MRLIACALATLLISCATVNSQVIPPAITTPAVCKSPGSFFCWLEAWRDAAPMLGVIATAIGVLVTLIAIVVAYFNLQIQLKAESTHHQRAAKDQLEKTFAGFIGVAEVLLKELSFNLDAMGDSALAVERWGTEGCGPISLDIFVEELKQLKTIDLPNEQAIKVAFELRHTCLQTVAAFDELKNSWRLALDGNTLANFHQYFGQRADFPKLRAAEAERALISMRHLRDEAITRWESR